MHAGREPGTPLEAQFARAITLLQAGPPLLVVLWELVVLPFAVRPLGGADLAVVLGALVLAALAVISAALMGQPRRLAWSGALTTNALTVITLIAGFVVAAILSSRVAGTGTDGGMVLVSVLVTFAFVGLPLIVLSMAAVVLLVLPAVWRHYWRAGHGEALGSVMRSRLGSLT